jgi:hypothetical protein
LDGEIGDVSPSELLSSPGNRIKDDIDVGYRDEVTSGLIHRYGVPFVALRHLESLVVQRAGADLPSQTCEKPNRSKHVVRDGPSNEERADLSSLSLYWDSGAFTRAGTPRSAHRQEFDDRSFPEEAADFRTQRRGHLTGVRRSRNGLERALDTPEPVAAINLARAARARICRQDLQGTSGHA